MSAGGGGVSERGALNWVCRSQHGLPSYACLFEGIETMAKQKRGAIALAAKKGQHEKQLDYDSWVNDYRVASKWMSQYDLESLVEEAGGLVRLENFFPEHIADGVLRVLERIKHKEWKETVSKGYERSGLSMCPFCPLAPLGASPVLPGSWGTPQPGRPDPPFSTCTSSHPITTPAKVTNVLTILPLNGHCALPAQAATEDYTQNNIAHRFDSTKQAKGLDAVTRLFTLLRPDSLHAFSAARYCRSDHIAPHDDRAYTQVRGCGAPLQLCSRPGWKAMGNREHVPQLLG